MHRAIRLFPLPHVRSLAFTNCFSDKGFAELGSNGPYVALMKRGNVLGPKLG